MFIFLKAALCEKVSIARNKKCLMFYAICDKVQPFFAGLSIAVGPCERRSMEYTNTSFCKTKTFYVVCVCAGIRL